MASLAATLLCYYDEETAFVMLVRMFELRGLEKLYQAGFGGLMAALEEFEGGWIKGGSVSRKLVSLVFFTHSLRSLLPESFPDARDQADTSSRAP